METTHPEILELNLTGKNSRVEKETEFLEVMAMA
jgi:hypothetical protein